MNARILTHIRCHRDDAIRALETGVGGIDVVIGTSPKLMQHSHGKSINQIIDVAAEVLCFIREQAPDMSCCVLAPKTPSVAVNLTCCGSIWPWQIWVW